MRQIQFSTEFWWKRVSSWKYVRTISEKQLKNWSESDIYRVRNGALDVWIAWLGPQVVYILSRIFDKLG